MGVFKYTYRKFLCNLPQAHPVNAAALSRYRLKC